MKKIIFAIAIILTLGMTASAQRGTDGFFNYSNGLENRTGISSTTPALPDYTDFNNNGDVTAPLGTGLLILTALGAGYAVASRRKK